MLIFSLFFFVVIIFYYLCGVKPFKQDVTMKKSNNMVFAFMAVILFAGGFINPLHFPLAAASAALYFITGHSGRRITRPGKAGA